MFFQITTAALIVSTISSTLAVPTGSPWAKVGHQAEGVAESIGEQAADAALKATEHAVNQEAGSATTWALNHAAGAVDNWAHHHNRREDEMEAREPGALGKLAAEEAEKVAIDLGHQAEKGVVEAATNWAENQISHNQHHRRELELEARVDGGDDEILARGPVGHALGKAATGVAGEATEGVAEAATEWVLGHIRGREADELVLRHFLHAYLEAREYDSEGLTAAAPVARTGMGMGTGMGTGTMGTGMGMGMGAGAGMGTRMGVDAREDEEYLAARDFGGIEYIW